MSTTAYDMSCTIATDQGNLIGLSEHGAKTLIAEMQRVIPDKVLVERILKDITLLNLQNVRTEVSEAGYKLLIDTVCKNPKITSFNFSATCFNYLNENIQYSILHSILQYDYRPLKLINLSYSSMRGQASSPEASVQMGVNEVLPILEKHGPIGSLYLRNIPQYQQRWDPAEIEARGREESERLARRLSSLLKKVSVQRLDIEGAGIPILEVFTAPLRSSIESLNLNNNIIDPCAITLIIELLKKCKSLLSLTMSNMKFGTSLRHINDEIENVSQQEMYSKMLYTLLTEFETEAMKRMRQSKEGSSSSASSSSSSSSSSVLSTSSSSSSSSSSSTLSAMASSSIPFLSSPPTTTKVGRIKEAIRKQKLSTEEMKELFEYLKKHLHLNETRATQAKELDNSGDSHSLSKS